MTTTTSAAEHLVSLTMLAAALVPVAIGAVALRRGLVGEWAGAPARLAEVVLGLGVVSVTLEAIGAVGGFHREFAVPACAAAGVAAWWVERRRASPAPAAPQAAPRPGRAVAFVALAGAALVGVQWTARSLVALDHGMPNVDTLWYHMPIAARFVQGGDTTVLTYMADDAQTAFYPAGSELLHAFGVLLFGSDVLSPMLNLGWLALGLLAAWCIGRPFGAAPASLLGGAVAFGVPVVAGSQAGDASTDVVAAALGLAAVAVLLTGGVRRGTVVVAAVAVGLAVGVKLTVAAVALGLTVGVVVLARRAERLRIALTWGGVVGVTGGFWFARNLVAVGHPLPWLGELGPLSLPSADVQLFDRFSGSPIAHVLEPGVWSESLRPALRAGLGPAWFAVAGSALAGSVLAVVQRRAPVLRMAGAIGLVAVAGYLAAPSRGPDFFYFSLRYCLPALALGLPLLPVALPRLAVPIAYALAALFLVTVLAGDGWPDGRVAAAFAAVGLAAAVVGLCLAARGRARALQVGVAVAAATAVAVGALAVERHYERGRYAGWADNRTARSAPWGAPFSAAWDWARTTRDRRVAVAGTLLVYPLYGPDLSNRVVPLGRESALGIPRAYRTCRAWRAALHRGGFDYVVTGPVIGGFGTAPPAAAWTRAAAGAHEIVGGPDQLVSVFRLDSPPDPALCPG